MRISCRDGSIVDIGSGEGGLAWGSRVTKISRGPLTLLFRGIVWIGDELLDEEMPGLDALLQRGMQALLEKAEGRFWLVLFNSESKKLDVAVDPFAGFPLYFVRRGRELHISDDPLEAGGLSSGNVDRESAAMMLTVGYVLAGKSLFTDVSTLGPGLHFSISPGRDEAIRNYVRDERETATGYKIPEELVEDIDTSLNRLRRCGRRPLVCLSGGVDSRLMISRLLASGIDFEALSWSGQKVDPATMDDHGVGAILAAAAGVPHHSWRWSLENFPLSADAGIYRTAGMSNNFQIWPQGDGFLERFSDRLVIWSDETFGWQRTARHLGTVFAQLGFLTFKDERVGAFPDLLSMLLERHPYPDVEDEVQLSRWKQRLYSEERLASFIMKNHLAIGRHTTSYSPFLSRRIVSRFYNTAPELTNEKLLARQALEISRPAAFASIPFARHPAFDPPGRSMLIWRQCRDTISDTLARRTELMDFVNAKAYLDDLENGEVVHRLRLASQGASFVAVERYLSRFLPANVLGELSPGLKSYMQLNVNRPAGDAFPCIYSMQRYLLAAAERRAQNKEAPGPD